MRLPALNVIGTQKMLTDSFVGLDTRPRASMGAFFDMENMQGDPAPLIATRKRRGFIRRLSSPHAAAIAKSAGPRSGQSERSASKPV